MSRLNRRQFVVGAAGLGLLVGCGRLPWQAESAARVPRIGYLALQPPSTENRYRQEAFLQGLSDYGYIEGQNLFIERRYAEGKPENLPALAAELVALPVDLIFAADGTPGGVAARQATTTIPIVVPSGDLVGTGLVASLARPGGNVTGLTPMTTQLSGKRLELLKAAVPSASRVAAIWEGTNPSAALNLRETWSAAGALGVTLQPFEARDASDLEVAFQRARREADAVLMLAGPVFAINLAWITDLAAESRLPALYQAREYVEVGGLMSYGPNGADGHRRAAYYVDRILKGAKPADFPVEQPMTFDFVVNMKTARELGIIFPQEILLQITEVIDQ